MKKTTGIVIGAIVAAAVIAVGAIWYFNSGKKADEPPKNAQSVAGTADNAPAKQQGETSPEAAAPAADASTQNGGAAAGNVTPVSPDDAPAEKVTPTFMYFVTNGDLADEQVKAMLDTLQKEYADKVNFDIKNVDEDPTLLERFSFVENQTPALIMLNTTNDICDIKLKNSDIEIFRTVIGGALQ